MTTFRHMVGNGVVEEEEEEITSVQPKGHDEMTLSMKHNRIRKSNKT